MKRQNITYTVHGTNMMRVSGFDSQEYLSSIKKLQFVDSPRSITHSILTINDFPAIILLTIKHKENKRNMAWKT